jgi:cache domain-containing protein
MRLSYSTLIIRSCAVLSVIGFLYAIGIGLQFSGENRTLLSEGLQSAQQRGGETQTQIESTLRRVAEKVGKVSENLFKNGQDDPQQLLETIRKVMYSDPNFVEAGVAFAPFVYDPQFRLYGFSYVVDEDGMQLRDLDVNEDYTKTGAVGYHSAMEGKTVWLEPKYDEARHEMLVTYAAPLFKPEEPSKPVGVVFATYSVSSFKRVLDNMDLGENGYGFLLSSERHFIVHHNQDYIDHRWSLDDFLGRLKNKSVVNAVSDALLNSSRTVRLTDPDSEQDSQVFFLQIPEAAWTLGILLNNRDLVMPSSIAHLKLLRMVLVLCLSIFLLTIPLSGIQHASTRSFWILSNVFTVCCIISYVTALKLTIDQPPVNFENSQLITNQNILNHFMSDQRRRTLDQREEVPLFIPTGIYIQSVSFGESIGVDINGYLWQRYTLGTHDDIDRGVVIPGSDSFELEKPVTTRFGNTELVRWGFKATLNQDFDYSRYPFGKENIQIQLQHKQFTRNVILIPDLESYKITNPAAKTGLQHNLHLQGWNIARSFFNYRFENYSTSFGLINYAGLTEIPELFFTIEISKQVFGAIISHALPLVVVAILLFALLLLASNIKAAKLEVVEAIAACSGFFLVIIFSHLGMRESFAIKDIIYLEYYYYITYVLILFTVANYVIVTTTQKQDQPDALPFKIINTSALVRLIRYRNHIVAKVLYWPLSQLTVLILTLQEFY